MKKSELLREAIGEYAKYFGRIYHDKRKGYTRIRVYFRSKTVRLSNDQKQQIVDDIESRFNATHIKIEKRTPCCAGCMGLEAKWYWSVTFRNFN